MITSSTTISPPLVRDLIWLLSTERRIWFYYVHFLYICIFFLFYRTLSSMSFNGLDIIDSSKEVCIQFVKICSINQEIINTFFNK